MAHKLLMWIQRNNNMTETWGLSHIRQLLPQHCRAHRDMVYISSIMPSQTHFRTTYLNIVVLDWQMKVTGIPQQHMKAIMFSHTLRMKCNVLWHINFWCGYSVTIIWLKLEVWVISVSCCHNIVAHTETWCTLAQSCPVKLIFGRHILTLLF